MLDLERREDEILKSGPTRDTTNLPSARPQGSTVVNPTVRGQQLDPGMVPQLNKPGLYAEGQSVRSLQSFNDGGDDNEVVSASDLLQQRAKALKDRNPGLSTSAAMDQAMKEPRIRKALAAERDARLQAASRIYG